MLGVLSKGSERSRPVERRVGEVGVAGVESDPALGLRRQNVLRLGNLALSHLDVNRVEGLVYTWTRHLKIRVEALAASHPGERTVGRSNPVEQEINDADLKHV